MQLSTQPGDRPPCKSMPSERSKFRLAAGQSESLLYARPIRSGSRVCSPRTDPDQPEYQVFFVIAQLQYEFPLTCDPKVHWHSPLCSSSKFRNYENRYLHDFTILRMS